MLKYQNFPHMITNGLNQQLPSFITDIDECAPSSSNNCHNDAQCNNNKGSYTCACKNGYNGDGRNCNGTFLSITFLVLPSKTKTQLWWWCVCLLCVRNHFLNFISTKSQIVTSQHESIAKLQNDYAQQKYINVVVLCCLLCVVCPHSFPPKVRL